MTRMVPPYKVFRVSCSVCKRKWTSLDWLSPMAQFERHLRESRTCGGAVAV